MKYLRFVPLAACVGAFGYLAYLQVRHKIVRDAVKEKAGDALEPLGELGDKIGDRIGGIFDGKSDGAPSDAQPSAWSTETQAIQARQPSRGAVTVEWMNQQPLREIALPSYKTKRPF